MKMGKPEKDSEANMFVGVQGKALQQQDEQSSLDDKPGGRRCSHLESKNQQVQGKEHQIVKQTCFVNFHVEDRQQMMSLLRRRE